MCPGGYPIEDAENWQSAFLPGIYQGTYIDTQHTEIDKLIENIRSPHASRATQRRQLDLLHDAQRRAPSERDCDAAARGPDPVVRAGLPDADRGGRRLRRHPRAGDDPRHVRRPASTAARS